MNNIISLSGGKDSTAMLLMMIERNEPIHSVIFFDTGWEFPEMYVHLDLLEKNTGVKIWKLHSCLPFEYWMTARPIVARKGENKGKIHRIGNGWPSMTRRWCTGKKVSAIELFCRPIPNPISCVGYAADETKRSISNPGNLLRFPLQEYNITEAQALQYCYDKGYNWGGLYNHFSRVSCFCCPLQRIGELRTLRKHFPELWNKMLEMDKAQPGHNKGFMGYKTVHDLDGKFAEEERQMKFERRGQI